MNKVFLGKRISEQRKLKRLKQDELAKMVGIGSIHLSEIERGKKTPSMETFIKIVNSLDVPADILLRDAVNGAKPYILNDFTYKVKDLAPEQLKVITDFIDVLLNNLHYFDKKPG